MKTSHLIPLLAAVLSTSAIQGPCLAHEGPEHEIEELTEQIKVQRDSPDLYIRRAIEYRVLGKHAEAARDLEEALALQEESIAAQRELSEVYFSLGKTNEALTTATRGLRSPADDSEKASLLMVRAEILRARRDYQRALDDATEAIEKYPQNVEWYLTRSQLQNLLDLDKERVAGLEEGMRVTGSGLLRGEWVEALIAAGQLAEAAEVIEMELRESRWKSAWLLRRAKLRLAEKKTEEAKSDLQSALRELNDRIDAGSPDALLLADRGLAYDLLDKKDDARRDYRAAVAKGLSDEWVRQRIRALRRSDRNDD